MTYTEAFFAERAERANRDAQMMVPDIVAAIGKAPGRVIDFGCGDGAMLRHFAGMGSTSLIGVDAHGPDEWSRQTGGVHVRADLTAPVDLHAEADLVVCLEVAEHLPEASADTLVETLIRHGKRIVFSAAPPGQGGTDHINEQPLVYWQEKFARHGYEFQDLFRHRLCPDISPWYRANTWLVAHSDHIVTMPSCKITMARYRDCFKEVEDAVNELRFDPAERGPDGVPRRLIGDVYRSQPMAFHELAHSAVVDKMRSALATEFLEEQYWGGIEYALNIDADTGFRKQQAVDLAVAAKANGWDIATALYTTKQRKPRVVHQPFEGETSIGIGAYAKPYELRGIGFGFCVVSRRAFEAIRDAEVDVPTYLPWPHVVSHRRRPLVERTWFNDGKFVWDFFRPTLDRECDITRIDPTTGLAVRGYWNEDFAWCGKARAAGLKIMAQPQIFVSHIGRYSYGPSDLQG
jgi:hypothetical protein